MLLRAKMSVKYQNGNGHIFLHVECVFWYRRNERPGNRAADIRILVVVALLLDPADPLPVLVRVCGVV